VQNIYSLNFYLILVLENSSSANKEDFFHVIQAAKEVGIAPADEANIWA